MANTNKSMRVWSHNALLGAAAMIGSCADRILRSPTATIEAKVIARTIKNCVGPLSTELKTRVD